MSKRAFTLIEILVAIAIFSVIVTITAYSFKFSLGIVKFLKTPYLQELENLSKLRDSFNSLFFFLSEDDGTMAIDKKFSFFFKGNNHRVIFITTKPLFHKRDFLFILEIKFDHNSLKVREYPVYDPLVDYKIPSIPSKIPYTNLLSNIKSFDLKYFQNGNWQNSMVADIPELIRLSYEKKNGEKRVLYFKVQSDFYQKKQLSEYLYNPF